MNFNKPRLRRTPGRQLSLAQRMALLITLMAVMVMAAAAANLPPRYSGRCANLSATERAERLAQGVAHAVRFRLPADADASFTDLIKGSVTVPAGTFRALKVELAGRRGQDLDPLWQVKQPGRFALTAWFVPGERRAVKAHHRSWTMQDGPFADETVELLRP